MAATRSGVWIVPMASAILLWNIQAANAWVSLNIFPKPQTTSTPKIPPSNVKILILPGFGNDREDYFLQDAPEGSLVQSLRLRGWERKGTDGDDPIRVLPVARPDWLNVFTRGALDWDFWTSEAPPTRPAFRWYLDLITNEVQSLCENDGDRVVLLGHSAGGWLARAALGYCSSADSWQSPGDRDAESRTLPLDKILGLVTLGTPHLPPPPGVMDMTRGALRLTHETFPDTFHAPDLFYITVMGESVTGTTKDPSKKPWEKRTSTEFAFDSYEGVCGQGDSIGDGVVPLCAGHLDGAQQITLPGVLHSINAPSRWYGSDAILDKWHTSMLDAIYKMNSDNMKSTPREQANWIAQMLAG